MIGMHIKDLGHTRYGAHADALRAARGEPIHQAAFQVEALTTVDCDHFYALIARGAQVQLAMGGMLEDVAGKFGRHQGHAPGVGFIKTQQFGKLLGAAPGIADLADIFDQKHLGQGAGNIQVHRVIVTRVPSPGAVSSSNSSTRRLAPVRPRPRPLPEVQPSVRASLRSGMPGPSSRKVRRRPGRWSLSTTLQSMYPPPP